MATRTQQQRHNGRNQGGEFKEAEGPQEIAQDLIEFVTEYAREKPGYAALWCLGLGFILGWKLKPW